MRVLRLILVLFLIVSCSSDKEVSQGEDMSPDKEITLPAITIASSDN